ncbi:MAG: hypothetical protein E6G94_09835 [Alphaproteobacteria bacterium]|nr:MAG: hypothetical protein E6G94_09835 [Alphaproteobacteria bacterium]
MKCLIIAAGQGTRIRSIAESKPLASLNGTPLIEHVVRLARAGGASQFVVVTGYQAEILEPFLADLAERAGVPIRAVRNPEWHRPNGVSVLAAAERLDGEFGLLMSDHLFSTTPPRSPPTPRDVSSPSARRSPITTRSTRAYFSPPRLCSTRSAPASHKAAPARYRTACRRWRRRAGRSCATSASAGGSTSTTKRRCGSPRRRCRRAWSSPRFSGGRGTTRSVVEG